MRASAWIIAVFSIILNSEIFGDFTIGTIPDTQNISKDEAGKQKMAKMMQFYIDNKVTLNLKWVASLGDMTQSGANDQWQRNRDVYDLLVNAGIPYSPCQGNHDPDLGVMNIWFPVSDFQHTPEFGGYFRGIENAYYFLNVEGMEFIIVVIQTHDQFIGFYDQPSLDWANGILDQYSDKRAIVVTHDFYERNWIVDDVLSKHDNLFLAVCGHSCSRQNYSTVLSPSGNTVHLIMSDYQCDADGGATNRYYTFRPVTNEICAFTYRTTDQQYETGPQSQFCFDYDMITPTTPQISGLTRTPSAPGPDEAVTVSATIRDDIAVSAAVLKWGSVSGSLSNEVPLTANGDVYSGDIPGQSLGTRIFYVVEASDGDGNIEITEEKTYSIELLLTSWNSWDIELSSGSPQATVTDGQTQAEIEFYESTGDGSVSGSSLFSSFNTTHADGFNDLNGYWSGAGTYPYAGKNATARTAAEPAPAGVLDLQMHPPDNNHLVVCAFVAPLDGTYKVSSLGARRVENEGANVSVILADKNGSEITTLGSSSRTWSIDENTNDVGLMSAGDKIYFGMSNVDGFSFDAAEVSWTVNLYGADGTTEAKTMAADGKRLSLDFSPVGSKLFFPSPERLQSITLTGMSGRAEVINSPLSGNMLDLSGIRSGIYYIHIEDSDGRRLVRKLILMH